MSNTKNTGGPAFPNNIPTDFGGRTVGGMTLRDYFAAKAMQGFLSVQWIDYDDIDVLSTRAYKWADAMLKAREQ